MYVIALAKDKLFFLFLYLNSPRLIYKICGCCWPQQMDIEYEEKSIQTQIRNIQIKHFVRRKAKKTTSKYTFIQPASQSVSKAIRITTLKKKQTQRHPNPKFRTHIRKNPKKIIPSSTYIYFIFI